MRIPDQFLKGVFFVGVNVGPDDKLVCQWKGTGFLLSMPSVFPETGFIYFVTARHVIAEATAGGKPIFFRFNGKNGDSITLRITDSIKWFFNPNEAVASDVAIYPMLADPDYFGNIDYACLTVDMLLTDQKIEELNIGAGDDALVIGLFSFFAGRDKNYPIVRTGNVAMMPKEPVRSSKFGDLNVYLVEAQSIGGLSGSPVLVVKERPNGQRVAHVLGLIHGHWEMSEQKDENGNSVSKNVNAGIAMVNPAKQIIETLMHPKLQDVRKEMEAAYMRQHPKS